MHLSTKHIDLRLYGQKSRLTFITIFSFFSRYIVTLLIDIAFFLSPFCTVTFGISDEIKSFLTRFWWNSAVKLFEEFLKSYFKVILLKNLTNVFKLELPLQQIKNVSSKCFNSITWFLCVYKIDISVSWDDEMLKTNWMCVYGKMNVTKRVLIIFLFYSDIAQEKSIVCHYSAHILLSMRVAHYYL